MFYITLTLTHRSSINYIYYFFKMKGNYVGVMSSEHLQQRAEPSAQFNKWIHEDHLNLTVSLLCRFDSRHLLRSDSSIFSKAVLVLVGRWRWMDFPPAEPVSEWLSFDCDLVLWNTGTGRDSLSVLGSSRVSRKGESLLVDRVIDTVLVGTAD